MATYLDAKIFKALNDRLDTMSGGYTIVEPNEVYEPSADEAFIFEQDVRFDNVRPHIDTGSSDWQTGVFSLAVMTPISWSYSQSLGIVGLIQDHFPKDLQITVSDVLVKITHKPQAIGNGYRDGNLFRIPVSIRWSCSA